MRRLDSQQEEGEFRRGTRVAPGSRCPPRLTRAWVDEVGGGCQGIPLPRPVSLTRFLRSDLAPLLLELTSLGRGCSLSWTDECVCLTAEEGF